MLCIQHSTCNYNWSVLYTNRHNNYYQYYFNNIHKLCGIKILYTACKMDQRSNIWGFPQIQIMGSKNCFQIHKLGYENSRFALHAWKKVVWFISIWNYIHSIQQMLHYLILQNTNCWTIILNTKIILNAFEIVFTFFFFF